MSMKKYEFWFITGSQHLYGNEVIKKVESHSREIASRMDESVCAKVICKGVMKTPDEITDIIKKANYSDECAGIITWMHTFSPSKMWINGLKSLQKPMMHFHTQYNREIPVEEIDMDFMNLNQSAHGDREHGFINARLRSDRKVVVGYWQEESVLEEISKWMRSAAGVVEGNNLKIVRFADNMREVAVTEGDKVESQIKLGWSVNSLAMGDLAKETDLVTDDEIMKVFDEVEKKYNIVTSDTEAVKYQIRIEIAFEKICKRHGFGGIVTCFENLYGLKQLPGLSCQRMMEKGYGFGAEGDWKTCGLMRIMKIMEKGLDGGTTFMEDYTYHLEEGNEIVLGAHMLEVDPSVASGPVKIDVKPLGIGDREDPARMIFEGKQSDAILASLVDMGGRMRLVVADIETVAAIDEMPNLPVARVMWKLKPDFKTGTKAWIYAGGAHHSVLSHSLDAGIMRDYARMADIEFIHINENTDINRLEQELMISDIIWAHRK